MRLLYLLKMVTGFFKIAGGKNEQRSNDMLAAIIESSSDAIISKNLEGIITSWNQGAERIFGYKQNEAIGKSISIIIPETKLGEEKQIIERILKSERINHFETIRKTKEGREINVSLAVSPVKDKSGKIIGASKVARDITERTAVEQQISNYKDEFMAMASHELKTPLTVIKANLQILESVMRADDKICFVNNTLRQVDKLTELISNLFDVSKIQAGELELEPAIFDFSEFIEEVIDSVRQTSPSHKIILKTVDKKLIVKADRNRLEQVVINMVSNAIKYSPNAKEITIDVLPKDQEIVVKVSDVGIGIPPEDIDKVFIRFFHGRGLASTFPGSGTGLYISSEIIGRHGGRMWVESEPGKGSDFYFSIPKFDRT